MDHVIRYLRNDAPAEIRDIDPTRTVLQHLRRDLHATGTKEGCAEGDCGACTVVVGEPHGDGIRYQAINACIQFIGTLHGKVLITVEDLAGADGTLHPVQHAMVEHHGSQCGFCTPGFVMSLFTLAGASERPTRAEIDDALAGNLCRCTGYRPIIDAAADAAANTAPDRFRRTEPERLAALRRLQADLGSLDYQAAGKRFLAPDSLDGLASALASHPDACILAGGTDVGLWVTKQHRSLEMVIHTGRVAELHASEETADGLTLGGAVTYSDAFDALARLHADVGEMVRRIGSRQIRNAGTIGGNVANGSPIGDTMPVLLALGAKLTLRAGEKTREIPLDAFYTGYRQSVLGRGEFIQSIHVPRPGAGAHFACYKISKRFDQDISAVAAAFHLKVDGDGVVRDARLGFGGMAATPMLADAAARALVGQRWSLPAADLAADRLAEDFSPLSDMRASAAYRLRVAGNLLRKFAIETTAPAPPATRIPATIRRDRQTLSPVRGEDGNA